MKVLIDVPYLDQSQEAPTGCESVTAVMLLQFLGKKITIREFIDRYLDKEDFTEKNGELWGPDPDCKFAGDPTTPEAMGCYAGVIRNALSAVLGGEYTVTDETGCEIDDLIERFVKKGMPVPLWITIDLKPAYEGPYWTINGTGERFAWHSNEHCALLCGFDDTHYWFNDPWDNHGVVAYDKEIVRIRHREQGMRAVGVSCE